MVEKWLEYELLQLELADISKRVRPSLGRIGYSPARVRPSPGRIGYSPARVRPILIFWLLWEDCPLELDATLGAKDDLAVVVLGIGEVLNSGKKPSPIGFGHPGARPSRRERIGVNTQYEAALLSTIMIVVLRIVGVLA